MRAVVIACTSDNTDKNCDVRSSPLTSYITIVIITIIPVITITTSFGDVIIIIVVIIMMSGPLPRSSSIQTRIRGMTTMHTGFYISL